MTIDLAHLKAKAVAYQTTKAAYDADCTREAMRAFYRADAEFHEAAYPTAIISIIDRVEKQEKQIANMQEAYRNLDGAYQIASARYKAAEALVIDNQTGAGGGKMVPLQHHIEELRKLQARISELEAQKDLAKEDGE